MDSTDQFNTVIHNGNSSMTLAFMNIKGQTNLDMTKQNQIEDKIKQSLKMEENKRFNKKHR